MGKPKFNRAGARVLALACVISLFVAAAALAAHPRHGALYTGTIAPGSLGKVRFRVSDNGKRMLFKGKTAFTVECTSKGKFTGGGEALVVQKNPVTAEMKAPVVKIHSNGTFYGAGTRTFKPQAAPQETIHYHFTGRFTGNGTTAVGKFIENGCSSPKFSLKKS